MIRLKRDYDDVAPDDGWRFLVERLWPRGVRKEALQIEEWVKDVAPSAEPRRWYDHDVAKWREFQRRYTAELDANAGAWTLLLDAARAGTITLVYAAKDTEHNSALLLKRFLDARTGDHS